ncbi:MAG: SRPBCC family protein [Chloroflexi bacterium]|nr:SRPBCC family protein [Chloroflexota bacterium]
MIEIREQFDVAAPPDRVWRVLSDPQAVVGCVPGASIVKENEDGSLDTSVVVKFGPTRVTFRVQATLTLDDAARQGTITAQGKDGIGGTRMRSTARFGVVPGPAEQGSRVTVSGQVEVSGRLASLIEGGASLVVQRMSGEFAERLAARCSA